MSKQAGKKHREEKARRRLIEAQVKLHVAHEKRAQAVAQAEQKLEHAKQYGQSLVAKATERVERRAGAIARAEAALLALTRPHARPPVVEPKPVDAVHTAARIPTDVVISTPEQTADLLERREAQVAELRSPSPIVTPDAAELDWTITPVGSELAPEHDS